MLATWIYGVPTWVMGTVVIALIVVLSLLGLAATNRFLALEEQSAPTIEATKPPHW